MKKIKVNKEAHTPNTKKGMGDFMGTAVRNSIGKPIDISTSGKIGPKKIKTPPKSMA